MLLRKKANEETALLLPHFGGWAGFEVAEWQILTSPPLSPSPEKGWMNIGMPLKPYQELTRVGVQVLRIKWHSMHAVSPPHPCISLQPHHLERVACNVTAEEKRTLGIWAFVRTRCGNGLHHITSTHGFTLTARQAGKCGLPVCPRREKGNAVGLNACICLHHSTHDVIFGY